MFTTPSLTNTSACSRRSVALLLLVPPKLMVPPSELPINPARFMMTSTPSALLSRLMMPKLLKSLVTVVTLANPGIASRFNSCPLTTFPLKSLVPVKSNLADPVPDRLRVELRSTIPLPIRLPPLKLTVPPVNEIRPWLLTVPAFKFNVLLAPKPSDFPAATLIFPWLVTTPPARSNRPFWLTLNVPWLANRLVRMIRSEALLELVPPKLNVPAA